MEHSFFDILHGREPEKKTCMEKEYITFPGQICHPCNHAFLYQGILCCDHARRKVRNLAACPLDKWQTEAKSMKLVFIIPDPGLEFPIDLEKLRLLKRQWHGEKT